MLLVLCLAVPALLLMAFSVYRYQQMEAEAEVRLQRALSVSHEHAMRILGINRTLLLHVLDVADPDVHAQDHAGLREQLRELARGQPQVRSIAVKAKDGRQLASSHMGLAIAPRELSDFAALLWEQLAKGQLHMSEVMTDQTTGERFFEMSLARREASGHIAGLVSVGMASSYFEHFHEALAAEEPGVAVTLFREDGAVYSRWPPLPDAPDRMSSTGEVLARVLHGETEGTVRNISSLDKQKRLILFRKLGDFPVYIGVGREFGALRADLLREVGLVAAFGAVPVFGLVFTAWLAMRRTRESLVSADRLQHESEARRQAEEALFQSQKMEALGRLTGGVAHDFNNALMVISGNVHLLRRTVSEAARRHLDAIGRAVESSAQLTRQLLAFSRRQALAPETVSLQERLPAMRDLLSPTLGSQVGLSIEVDPATAPVHVDVAELELALINLAVNARDAMPEGGHFSLRAAPQTTGDPGQAWVLIEATDSGHGMAADVAANAFDPFFTTKPAGKGTGLGLSQVYALCQRAGGAVEIQSAPGQGTTVRMRLPASNHPAPEQRPAPASDRQLSRTVLMVEDNEEVAQVVGQALQALGCKVAHVASAALALQALEAGSDAFDVLLTDVLMPGGMDGAALAVAVRERRPNLDIVLMTGYAQQIQAIEELGFRVLAKPFSPDALADLVAGPGAVKPA